jgi:xanthine dehydrogenase YagR molybdenum-binding subunit
MSDDKQLDSELKKGSPARATVLGQPVNRIDGHLKVTGKAKYSAEFLLPNLSYGVLLQSTIAKGRILDVDTSLAEGQPGVIKVITYKNAPKLNEVRSGWENALSLLQDTKIHYNRQNIGVVVAETFEAARDAAPLVVFNYATEKFDVVMRNEPAQLITPEPQFGRQPDNMRGDIEQGLALAAVQLTETYTTPTENHNPMETHSTTATWDGDKLMVYDSSQGMFGERQKLATIFGVPIGSVRVVSHFIGGGFGCKGSVWSHVPLCAMAAREVGRPVRLALARSENYGPVGFRPATIQKITVGAEKDGRFTIIRHNSINQSAYVDDFTEPTGSTTNFLYSCANVETTQRLLRLDNGKPTFMRAPGESTGSFALESAVDELSYKLKIDPIELRMKNYAEKDESRNIPYSSKALAECYKQGAERFGWSRRNPEPRSMRDGGILLGWGMASATYPVHRMQSSARAIILENGSAIVQAGSQDIGTGTWTVMTQIAADALSLPMKRVQFESGDTKLPATAVSGGSTTVSSTGAAIKLACDDVLNKLTDLCLHDSGSPLYGTLKEKIVCRDGGLCSVDDANKKESFGQIMSRSRLKSIEGFAKNNPEEESKNYSMHSFGAHFAEVRVDPDLGTIRVSRFVTAIGAGQIINAKTARSQLNGGVIAGIGMALFEETLMDKQHGRVINADLAEYHVPVHADIPVIDAFFVNEVDHIINPVGAKGIGEISIVGVAAAVANAVYHATGVRVRDLPITLDKVLS